VSTLWQAVLETDEAGALLAETLLEGEAFSLTRFRPDTEAPLWRMEAIFTEQPDAKWLKKLLGPKVVLAPVPEADWVTEAQKFLPPVQAGRFHVHGSRDRRSTSPCARLA
jgi:ribosomal protein L11 methylase PrmA